MITQLDLAKLELAAALARAHPNKAPMVIANFVQHVARKAVSLHKRYEAMCSYQWANTEEYTNRTEKQEKRLRDTANEFGVVISLQRDPRGWPVIITVDDREYRLG